MSYLIFNQSVSNKKPNTIRNKEISCPFCNRDNLSNILVEENEMIMVENKYPTIKDADMYVLI